MLIICQKGFTCEIYDYYDSSPLTVLFLLPPYWSAGWHRATFRFWLYLLLVSLLHEYPPIFTHITPKSMQICIYKWDLHATRVIPIACPCVYVWSGVQCGMSPDQMANTPANGIHTYTHTCIFITVVIIFVMFFTFTVWFTVILFIFVLAHFYVPANYFPYSHRVRIHGSCLKVGENVNKKERGWTHAFDLVVWIHLNWS